MTIDVNGRTVNSTNYDHSSEPNLNDLHKAMDYDVDGKPVLRVDIGSDININGDVNIPGTVTVNSTPEDPVHTHVTEVGTSGVLTTDYLPVGGTVSIGTDGTVSLSAATLSALETVTANVTFPDIQKISAVSSMPRIGNYTRATICSQWTMLHLT